MTSVRIVCIFYVACTLTPLIACPRYTTVPRLNDICDICPLNPCGYLSPVINCVSGTPPTSNNTEIS